MGPLVERWSFVLRRWLEHYLGYVHNKTSTPGFLLPPGREAGSVVGLLLIQRGGSTAMRASIIVVSYNSCSYLDACITSILQEIDPQDEVIIVDNASTDGSAEFVQIHYPQVQLICNQNTGYAGGNNRGAAEARGKHLVFLNPDTILHAGALEALLAPLEEETSVALTTACVVYMHRQNVINTCGNTIHYTGLTYCRGAGRPRDEYQVSTWVDAVSGAAFAIRRSVFEELGGFDERFFMYVEDTDLSWRAQLAGYQCMYVANAVVEHDYYSSYSPNKAYYLDRNRHLMLLKNLERAIYFRMLPGLLLGEIVIWGYLLLRGPRYWGVKIRVYRWMWEQWRTIRAEHYTARSLKRRSNWELVAQMTHRLEFEQLANRWIAALARTAFHPAFWVARRLFARVDS